MWDSVIRGCEMDSFVFGGSMAVFGFGIGVMVVSLWLGSELSRISAAWQGVADRIAANHAEDLERYDELHKVAIERAERQMELDRERLEKMVKKLAEERVDHEKTKVELDRLKKERKDFESIIRNYERAAVTNSEYYQDALRVRDLHQTEGAKVKELLREFAERDAKRSWLLSQTMASIIRLANTADGVATDIQDSVEKSKKYLWSWGFDATAKPDDDADGADGADGDQDDGRKTPASHGVRPAFGANCSLAGYPGGVIGLGVAE